jgi:hypothetical protein
MLYIVHGRLLGVDLGMTTAIGDHGQRGTLQDPTEISTSAPTTGR